jgi:hypothetical protein
MNRNKKPSSTGTKIYVINAWLLNALSHKVPLLKLILLVMPVKQPPTKI